MRPSLNTWARLSRSATLALAALIPLTFVLAVRGYRNGTQACVTCGVNGGCAYCIYERGPGEAADIAAAPAGSGAGTGQIVAGPTPLPRSWAGVGMAMRSALWPHVSNADDPPGPGGVTHVTVAHVPLWPLAVVAAVPWVRWRRRGHPPGQCRFCGYDLRTTTGRCPECGHPPGGMSPVVAAPAGILPP